MAAAPAHLEVFISHASEDAEHLKHLEDHLALLEREGVISTWYAGRMLAGEEVETHITAQLGAAQVILLVVSARYLARDATWRQLQRALDRHQRGEARVIPILLHPCSWGRERLGRLKLLPTDGRAISTWSNQAAAWDDVAKGIREAIGAIRGASAGLVEPPQLAAQPPRRGSERPPGATDHRLRPPDASLPPNNLPARNEHFVGREVELELLESLLTHEQRASVVQHRRASLYGLGGIGKSSLALEYAYRHAAQYPGGVWWVDAEGDPLPRMAALANALRAAGPPAVSSKFGNLPEAHDKLAEVIKLVLQNQQEPALVVLDNVTDPSWNGLVPAGRVHVLATTRDERLAIGKPAPLSVLPVDDAKALAVLIANEPDSAEEEQALGRVVLVELGGLAVAVGCGDGCPRGEPLGRLMGCLRAALARAVRGAARPARTAR